MPLDDEMTIIKEIQFIERIIRDTRERIKKTENTIL